MYMYYLLGYKIMELPISDERKEARAENTYLLALDGDVDFQPEAVIRCDILLQHILLRMLFVATLLIVSPISPPFHPLEQVRYIHRILLSFLLFKQPIQN